MSQTEGTVCTKVHQAVQKMLLDVVSILSGELDDIISAVSHDRL